MSRPLGTSRTWPASLNKIVLHKALDLTSALKGRKGLKKADLLPSYAISSERESKSEESSMAISRESASAQSLRDWVDEFGFRSADTSPSPTFILRPSHKKGQDANISQALHFLLDDYSNCESRTPYVDDDDILSRTTRRVEGVRKGRSPHSTTFQFHPVELSNFEVCSRSGTSGWMKSDGVQEYQRHCNTVTKGQCAATNQLFQKSLTRNRWFKTQFLIA